MPVQEPQPTCWGMQTDYVMFAGMVGWLVAAGLSWLCADRKTGADGDAQRALRRTWKLESLAYFAMGVVCAAALADGYGRLLGRFNLAHEIAVWAAVAAVVLQVALLPPPTGFPWRSSWRRAAYGIILVSLLGMLLFPAARPWWVIAGAGFAAVHLLSQGARLERGARLAEPALLARRLAGFSLLAIFLTWLVPRLWWLAAPHVPWMDKLRPWSGLTQAVILACGAWTVALGLWRLYLLYRTLPRIRAQRRLFGLRPSHLLPTLLTLVLGSGFFLTERDTAMAEEFVGGLLLSGLEDLARAAQWPEASTILAASSDRAGPPAPLQPALERVLSSHPGGLAAVLWSLEKGEPRLAAATCARGAGEAFDPSALLPASASERRRTAAGEAWVRWPPSIMQGRPVVAFLPRGQVNGAMVYLALELSWQELDDLVATQRAQMLAIVALLAALVGSAVVYLLRSLNEAELTALKERAEAENLAKTEFLAMVSHEVRTPLQSVLGYAELAQTEPLPGHAARHVSAIRSQGAILLRIVQDILDFSALRGGGLKLEPEPVRLAELANDVQVAFAERARAKGVALATDLEAEAPAAVVVDRVRLAQVLINLVGNAVKFTSRGGVRLSIRCPAVADGRAELEFVVSDTGPGITPVQRRRLFEPFRKLRDDDTPGGGGVGLGLAISRQIVEHLGGRIEVDSMAGDGATFRVRLNLPVAEHPSGRAAFPAGGEAEAVPSLRGLEILLVDDNPYVRELMREYLRRLGAVVATRPDGRSGLEAARSTRFDVVLLDMRLPDMDGRTLAVGIREHVRSAVEPWMVGMSAGVSDLEIQRALEDGFNDFILKPVSMAGLAETISLSPAGARIQPGETAVHASPAFEAEVNTEMRQAFFSEAGAVLARLAELCAAGASRQVVAEAHYLANGCLVVGCEQAFELCREIERLADGDDNAAAAERVRRLREVLLGSPAGAAMTS